MSDIKGLALVHALGWASLMAAFDEYVLAAIIVGAVALWFYTADQHASDSTSESPGEVAD